MCRGRLAVAGGVCRTAGRVRCTYLLCADESSALACGMLLVLGTGRRPCGERDYGTPFPVSAFKRSWDLLLVVLSFLPAFVSPPLQVSAKTTGMTFTGLVGGVATLFALRVNVWSRNSASLSA